MYKYEYRRQSIRLPGYDYGQTGSYYVTICVQNKQWPFGRIENDRVIKSPAGEMVDKWWRKIPAKFHGTELGEYIIMPDHFHGIIHIVGAPPCGRPCQYYRPGDLLEGGHTGQGGKICRGGPVCPPCISEGQCRFKEGGYMENGEKVGHDFKKGGHGFKEGRHMGLPLRGTNFTVSKIIQWFKTMTTNEYIRNVDAHGWEPFYGRLWQRNYYLPAGRQVSTSSAAMQNWRGWRIISNTIR